MQLNKILIVFTIISLLFVKQVLAHGGHKAFFTIEKVEGDFILIVKMEENDIRTELKKNDFSTDNLQISINNYIKDKMSIKLNGSELQFEFTSSYNSKGYIFLKYKSPVKAEPQSIEIKNTCFKNFDHLYYNIVRIHIDEIDVTYKMSDKRQSIEHKF